MTRHVVIAGVGDIPAIPDRAVLSGRQPRPFQFKTLGAFADLDSLGHPPGLIEHAAPAALGS